MDGSGERIRRLSDLLSGLQGFHQRPGRERQQADRSSDHRFCGTDHCFGDGTAAPEPGRLLPAKNGCQLGTVEYPGATHGFGRNAPAMRFFDPAAIGRRGHMAWNPEAANDARTRVVAFLRENLVAR